MTRPLPTVRAVPKVEPGAAPPFRTVHRGRRHQHQVWAPQREKERAAMLLSFRCCFYDWILHDADKFVETPDK